MNLSRSVIYAVKLSECSNVKGKLAYPQLRNCGLASNATELWC